MAVARHVPRRLQSEGVAVYHLAQSILFRRRRAWRQAPWDDAAAERMPVARGEQVWAVQLSDTARALRACPQNSEKR